MRAVVDTNVWVSAILTPGGFSARVLTAVADRRFEPVFSGPTLEELKDTVTDRAFVRRHGLRLEELNRAIGLLVPLGFRVEEVEVVSIARDPDDDIFIALAVAASADYLVTRDDDLKGDPAVRSYLEERGVRLITLREFAAVLEAAPGESA